MKVPKDSREEMRFLDAAKGLGSIPGVNNFKCLRQISNKNAFDYGIFMEFNSLKDYEAYNNHSEHLSFVQTFWVNCVDDFLELDFELQ
ncbi:Dabb family protein [Flavobacteriaceae bacterium F89]|uniref:Dabb family protein n=1 Tax=Cerina litoralis TaxID=2874477 RepID=A0AAE3ESP1_9FLAO|nr:Dabb family protein [Cerina litoralis]MCG2459738.1 Dabb family protein [Cerina litoralis]